jgi:hypothetical protein
MWKLWMNRNKVSMKERGNSKRTEINHKPRKENKERKTGKEIKRKEYTRKGMREKRNKESRKEMNKKENRNK